MDHNIFPEAMVIFIMRINVDHINFQLTLNSYWKTNMSHIKKFPIKLMWVISLCCAAVILKLISNVLARSLHEDLRERPGVLDPPYIHLD